MVFKDYASAKIKVKKPEGIAQESARRKDQHFFQKKKAPFCKMRQVRSCLKRHPERISVQDAEDGQDEEKA